MNMKVRVSTLPLSLILLALAIPAVPGTGAIQILIADTYAQ